VRSLIAMAAITLALTPLAASADAIVSPDALYARVASAPAAIVVSYELPEAGGLTAALESICRRGGRADVILAGDTYIVGDRVREIVDAAARNLSDARCAVRRAVTPLHLKMVALGGGETYLADRNFGRYATILRDDDPADRPLIAATLQNHPGSNGNFATLKGLALQIEAQTIADSAGDLAIESESFGPGTPVYDAIYTAAQSRRHVRLIVAASEVSASEQAALSTLERAGVDVRGGSADAKLAVADGPQFFIGSSNATAGYPDQIDWGKRITDAGLRATIRSRFEEDWAAASPLSSSAFPKTGRRSSRYRQYREEAGSNGATRVDLPLEAAPPSLAGQ
jgi:phosphatidylserine/phosphatidylglycerophosphate/cardiolipin synthase-like enzyme